MLRRGGHGYCSHGAGLVLPLLLFLLLDLVLKSLDALSRRVALVLLGFDHRQLGSILDCLLRDDVLDVTVDLLAQLLEATRHVFTTASKLKLVE